MSRAIQKTLYFQPHLISISLLTGYSATLSPFFKILSNLFPSKHARWPGKGIGPPTSRRPYEGPRNLYLFLSLFNLLKPPLSHPILNLLGVSLRILLFLHEACRQVDEADFFKCNFASSIRPEEAVNKDLVLIHHGPGGQLKLSIS